MKNKEISAKGYLLNSFLFLIISLSIPISLYYKMNEYLFDWEKFNPNGILTIIFLLFTIIGILSLLNLFDNNPILILNENGISFRKSILPFSSLKFINWNDINFIELKLSKSKSTTSTILVVHSKNYSKTITLDNINYPMEKIIDFVRNHSKLINYRDRFDIRN